MNYSMETQRHLVSPKNIIKLGEWFWVHLIQVIFLRSNSAILA